MRRVSSRLSVAGADPRVAEISRQMMSSAAFRGLFDATDSRVPAPFADDDDLTVAHDESLHVAIAGGASDQAARDFLARYRSSGVRALADLHGVFQLALVDTTRAECLLATDRLAIAPICYAADRGRLHFASSASDVAASLRGARVVDGAGPGTLDPQAIFDYLYSHCIPGPTTIYRGVKRLLPGHVLRFANGRAQIEPYWQPSYDEREREALPVLESRFLSTVEAVRRPRDRRRIESRLLPVGRHRLVDHRRPADARLRPAGGDVLDRLRRRRLRRNELRAHRGEALRHAAARVLHHAGRPRREHPRHRRRLRPAVRQLVGAADLLLREDGRGRRRRPDARRRRRRRAVRRQRPLCEAARVRLFRSRAGAGQGIAARVARTVGMDVGAGRQEGEELRRAGRRADAGPHADVQPADADRARHDLRAGLPRAGRSPRAAERDARLVCAFERDEPASIACSRSTSSTR